MENLDTWRSEFLRQIGRGVSNSCNNEYFPFVVLGNKIDKDSNQDRHVSRSSAEQWCCSKGGDAGIIPYFESSAKTGVGVEEGFIKAASLALIEEEQQRSQNYFSIPVNRTIALSDERDSPSKSDCC